jgi:hypothetical protein
MKDSAKKRQGVINIAGDMLNPCKKENLEQMSLLTDRPQEFIKRGPGMVGHTCNPG